MKMLFEFKIINDEIFNVDTKKVNNIKNKCILHFDKDTYKDKELFITFINKVGYSRTIILGKWREVNMTKELILKKNNKQITLMDKDDIQDRIDEAIANNNPGNLNILVTYDDDTTETLHLKGYTTWDNGGSGSSSGGGSASSSSND